MYIPTFFDPMLLQFFEQLFANWIGSGWLNVTTEIRETDVTTDD